MCIGRNYADHVKELNNQRPKQPFFFLKPSSSILLPTEGPILRPRGVNLHYEVELGIVIGKTLRDIDENDTEAWMSAIESYLLTIDMTGRNVQEEAKKKGLPWSIAKGFDTFLPVAGPIAPSKIKDPHNVELWLKVNGEVKQQDNTELMLFRIGRQLADISKVMTLEKDLLSRAQDVAEFAERLDAEYRAAREAERTAAGFTEWRQGRVTQAAAAWVLATVFVRYSEDNGLIGPAFLSEFLEAFPLGLHPCLELSVSLRSVFLHRLHQRGLGMIGAEQL